MKLNKNEIINWLHDDDSVYNLKSLHIQCKDIDHSRFKLLKDQISSFIFNNISTKYICELENTNFSWYPLLVEQSDKGIDIKLFLDKFNLFKSNKKGIGIIQLFSLSDLIMFFELFITYPSEFHYQNIYMFSSNHDFAIIISHHNDIWLFSHDANTVSNIFAKLDSMNFSEYIKLINT